MLLLVRTFHKLPPIYIFFLILDSRVVSFILIVSLLTIIVSSVFIFFIYDLRYLLIVSSIGNNSFIVLAAITNRIFNFLIFYVLYFLTMYLLLLTFDNIVNHSYSYTLFYRVFIIYLFVLLLNLASFPPFPAFFAKFLIFYECINIYPDIFNMFILIIVSNVLIIVRYVRIFFKYIVNVYGNSSMSLLY